MNYVLKFDGCCKGTKECAIGCVLYENNIEIWNSSKYIGIATNNIAEYSSLILGLEEIKNRGIDTIEIQGDSKLVIEQMNEKYKVKTEHLIPLYLQAKKLTENINIIFKHIYRDENTRADELCNEALEKKYFEDLINNHDYEVIVIKKKEYILIDDVVYKKNKYEYIIYGHYDKTTNEITKI